MNVEDCEGLEVRNNGFGIRDGFPWPAETGFFRGGIGGLSCGGGVC